MQSPISTPKTFAYGSNWSVTSLGASTNGKTGGGYSRCTSVQGACQCPSLGGGGAS